MYLTLQSGLNIQIINKHCILVLLCSQAEAARRPIAPREDLPLTAHHHHVGRPARHRYHIHTEINMCHWKCVLSK